VSNNVKKELVITDQAKADLRNIYEHIKQDSEHNAAMFLADLIAKINWIAEVDFTGSPRDHVRDGLRGLPYRKRSIFYRSFKEKIVIIRVLHDRQDLDRLDF
jgi:toxin ParE1/3/4